MNKPYSFSNEQMNGIVEETYANIIKECENLIKNTNCPNEQVVALLSVIASNFAINLNIKNLYNELRNKNYLIESPSIGISFDIPLDILESIFDFWLDIYKNQESWETCLGLLKIRKRISLTKLIKSESLKGNSKKWAIKVETLHTYVPNSLKIEKLNDPMWK